MLAFFFFFNDTATTEIYTLSLHDALPICPAPLRDHPPRVSEEPHRSTERPGGDRKSTRLNSSHANISYAVFCLKKKNTNARLRPAHIPRPTAGQHAGGLAQLGNQLDRATR